MVFAKEALSAVPIPDLVPVILSGGSGTRLWPLSRRTYPKQLLSLVGESSLLQQTAYRLAGAKPPILIANDDHRFLIRQQMEEAGIAPATLILEPEGRNTAPAVALACLRALEAADDPVVGIFPSDHTIQDQEGFTAALARAVAGAEAGHIVTFSIRPTRAETGYGYIRRGAALPGAAGLYAVDAFTEKPDAQTAEAFVASGDYGWNSGMFVFRASVMLEELAAHAPDVLAAARTALSGSAADLGFVRLDAAAFRSAPAVSVDVAVMERTRRAATVDGAFGWSDLGSWTALHGAAVLDPAGNAAIGPTVLRDVHNSYIRAEDGRLVAGIGLEDSIVVSTADAVLVAPRDRADEVKDLVGDMVRAGLAEAECHRRVARPWGTYEDIDREESFRVKRLVVNPGACLSLQRHRHRSEHWVVVRGTAHVTIDGETRALSRNQSTFVPIGSTHRLENRGTEPLHLIEVQVGDYVGEDDIERFEDVYGRD
jgi:mannose-1-phosphate guanylyltransferase/mannose-6-phosphate isomerase